MVVQSFGLSTALFARMGCSAQPSTHCPDVPTDPRLLPGDSEKTSLMSRCRMMVIARRIEFLQREAANDCCFLFALRPASARYCENTIRSTSGRMPSISLSACLLVDKQSSIGARMPKQPATIKTNASCHLYHASRPRSQPNFRGPRCEDIVTPASHCHILSYLLRARRHCTLSECIIATA